MSRIEILTAPNLQLAGIRHGFFTRRGGVSEGMYRGLNCGLGSADDHDAVVENRVRAAAAMGVAPERLLSLYQIHSADAVYASGPFEGSPPQADGLVTDVPELAICALSADCGQILLADAGARVVGACHAGWKGAITGIMDATVTEMENRGARRGSIHAALGPCLSQSNYEVGQEFADRFLAQDSGNARFFAPGTSVGKSHFDLAGYIEMRLLALGLASVWISGACTYADEGRFFSYRRATHRGEQDYGRLLSAISLC